MLDQKRKRPVATFEATGPEGVLLDTPCVPKNLFMAGSAGQTRQEL